MKKTPGDIIILHMRTINDNHMMYGSWDTECDRCNCYFSFGMIITLHKCARSYDLMIYCSWDTARDQCNCYFSFWAIFCLLPPLPEKLKFSKKWKNAWRYHLFLYVYQTLWLDDARCLRYGARETDRQTDGWMDGKSDT